MAVPARPPAQERDPIGVVCQVITRLQSGLTRVLDRGVSHHSIRMYPMIAHSSRLVYAVSTLGVQRLS